MTTNNERWSLALDAHAAEHAAMRERGLGRVGVAGRGFGVVTPTDYGARARRTGRAVVTPTDYKRQVAVAYSPRSRSMRSFMSRRGISGFGSELRESGRGKTTLFVVLGIAVAAGLAYIAYDELIGTGARLR